VKSFLKKDTDMWGVSTGISICVIVFASWEVNIRNNVPVMCWAGFDICFVIYMLAYTKGMSVDVQMNGEAVVFFN
jgi:hypothetical protein